MSALLLFSFSLWLIKFSRISLRKLAKKEMTFTFNNHRFRLELSNEEQPIISSEARTRLRFLKFSIIKGTTARGQGAGSSSSV